MRLLILIVASIFLTQACVTRPVVVLKETGYEPKRDLSEWIRYANNVMIKSDEEIATELTFLEEKQRHKTWKDEFKQALLTGLKADDAKEYKESIALLEKISRRENLDEQSSLAIQWFLLSVRRSFKLYEVADAQKKEAAKLKSKLRALSTIEKEIQERTDRVAR